MEDRITREKLDRYFYLTGRGLIGFADERFTSWGVHFVGGSLRGGFSFAGGLLSFAIDRSEGCYGR